MKKRLPPLLLILTGLVGFVIALVGQLSTNAPDIASLPLYAKGGVYIMSAVLFYSVVFYMIIPLFRKKK